MVDSNGVANFEGCNIHDNTAGGGVCLHLNLSLNVHPSPRWNVTCVHAWLWQGGGVYVNYGGEATLTNSNVYQNEAQYVRSLFEPSSSAPLDTNPTGYLHLRLPSHKPHWIPTVSYDSCTQALAGRAAKLKVMRFISRCEMCRLPRPSLRVHLAIIWWFWERPLPSTARSAGGSRHRR